MKLSYVQELAVQAVIASHVGREEFDKFFTGMQCGPILDGSFVMLIHNEYYANHILSHYTAIIAHSIWRVTGIQVMSVSVGSIDHIRQV
jgi:hypothetical protein